MKYVYRILAEMSGNVKEQIWDVNIIGEDAERAADVFKKRIEEICIDGNPLGIKRIISIERKEKLL